MKIRSNSLPVRSILLGTALLTPLLHADPYASAVISDSPVGYYPLGDPLPADVAVNSGSLGAALNGTHINVKHRTAGAILGSLSTASTYNSARTVIPYNAALNPPASLLASSSFTIEAWINPSVDDATPDGRAPLFNRHSDGNRQGWVFFQRSSTTAGWNFRMYSGVGSASSIDITGGNRNPGTWTHLAAVWNAPTSTATLYVDGAKVGEQTFVGGYVQNTDIPFSVGAYSANNPGDNAYMGDIDEVAYYPSALSLSQINAHAANGFDPDRTQRYPALVAADGAILHLRMDEYNADRVVATNSGTLTSDGNGLHFPGVGLQVPGALAGSSDTAAHYEIIDRTSTDGAYPTILPNVPELNTESFSWEGWVRPTVEGNPSNAQVVVRNYQDSGDRTGWVLWQRASVSGTPGGDGSGWNLRLYNGTGNNRTINITTGTGAGGYTVGQWQHLALTYNQTTQTALFYINGAQVATQTTTNGLYAPNPGTIVPTLAGFPSGVENPFAGDMDEVAFYDKVLPPSAISNHYANGINASRATPYPTLIAADAPVAYYHLNEAPKAALANFGTAGAAAAGTYVNSPAPITGPTPPAYKGFDVGTTASEFRGSLSYLELNNPPALNIAGPITLEAWVQPAAVQANFSNGIISHGGNDLFNAEVYLRIEDGNYEVGSIGGKASVAIPAGDEGTTGWVHLAGTWSAGTWTLYRNGTAIATGADANGAVAVPTANWAIGSRGRWKNGAGFPDNVDSGALRVFSGGITDAAIYSTALSADKIKAHFFAGVGLVPLAISRPSGVTTLDWSGGILQESADLNTWNDLPSAVSPYAPADGPKHFYRLRY